MFEAFSSAVAALPVTSCSNRGDQVGRTEVRVWAGTHDFISKRNESIMIIKRACNVRARARRLQNCIYLYVANQFLQVTDLGQRAFWGRIGADLLVDRCVDMFVVYWTVAHSRQTFRSPTGRLLTYILLKTKIFQLFF